MAPLQLSEEVFRVHSARLDEALVTAPLYLDACDLKSACNLNNRSEGDPAFSANLCADDSGNGRVAARSHTRQGPILWLSDGNPEVLRLLSGHIRRLRAATISVGIPSSSLVLPSRFD